MFSKEFFELLGQIIKSWQVIAVTVALVIYMYIVSYVSRSYHRPRVKKISFRRRKQKVEAAPQAGPEETESSNNSNDELGLEEA